MKRGRKRINSKKNPNQLRFDFNVNVPIEIHIPRYALNEARKDYNFNWGKKSNIELITN